MDLSKQYNAFAKEYSKLADTTSQKNAEVYFHHMNFPLKEKHILDIGCGDGADLAFLKEKGAILYGIDSSEEMVKIAQKKNPQGVIKTGTFEKIPFLAGSFDAVISKWALQSSPDITPIYQEIIRVLKPGGYLYYLTVHPFRQFIERKHPHKDYFKQELVESSFFYGRFTVKEPTHTLNDYLSPFFLEHFQLEYFLEGFDTGPEQIGGDIYPVYFIIRARLLNH